MQPVNHPKLAYSIVEAAHAISVGRSKIYELINSGAIETRRIGKRVVIPVGSLLQLLEAA